MSAFQRKTLILTGASMDIGRAPALAGQGAGLVLTACGADPPEATAATAIRNLSRLDDPGGAGSASPCRIDSTI